MGKLLDSARGKLAAAGPDKVQKALDGLANDGDVDVMAAKKLGMFLDEWVELLASDEEFRRRVRQAHAVFNGKLEWVLKQKGLAGDAKSAQAVLSKRQSEVFGTAQDREKSREVEAPKRLVVVTGFGSAPVQRAEDLI